MHPRANTPPVHRRPFARGALALSAAAVLAAATPRAAHAQSLRAVDVMPVPSDTAPLAMRAAAVRAACRDAQSVDGVTWGAASAFVAVGAGLAVTGFASFGPMQQQQVGHALLSSLGPGLVLGGVGLPFARGAFLGRSPLHAACDRVLRNWPGGADDEFDTEVAARILRSYAEPMSPVPAILLGAATAGVAGVLIAGFATNNVDVVQIGGGLAAAVLTGWFLLPPSPARVAAQRFTAGRYDRAYTEEAPRPRR